MIKRWQEAPPTPWAALPISQREEKGPPLRWRQLGKRLYYGGIALGKGALGHVSGDSGGQGKV